MKATRTHARGGFAPGRRFRNEAGCVERTAHSVRVCLGCPPDRAPAGLLPVLDARRANTPFTQATTLRTRPQKQLLGFWCRTATLALHFLASVQHDLPGFQGRMQVAVRI
jgi:hypothetical protein